jgi:hypothetical protein
MKYEKLKRFTLREHPTLSERWVQDRIAEDPSILGLGDVIVKDKERIQPRAGRLDLLLQDIDANRRYEVEIQLGKTDESHIIRTLEYWDIERKRYPQYEHTAVIVAEEINARFLNIIGLFNGTIPLIALQMAAVQVSSDSVSLMFTTVLDQLRLGLVDEDEEVREVTDRTYWEARASKATTGMADELLTIVREFVPRLELKYNKFYIGLAVDGQPNNFVIFKPQKSVLRVEPRLSKNETLEQKLDAAGLDGVEYDNYWGRYRLRVDSGVIKKHSGLLRELFHTAFLESGKGDG